MPDIWFVRAGKDSVYAEDFVQRKVVSIGWADIGTLESSTSKTKLVQLYLHTYPDHSEGCAQVAVSQIIHFMHQLKIGDEVMSCDRDTQLHWLGQITSACLWNPDLIPDLPRIRQVDWKESIPSNLLSSDAKNTLGAIQTLFLVTGKVATEIHEKALAIQQPTPQPSVTPKPSANQAEVEREIRAKLVEKSEQAIEDRITRPHWGTRTYSAYPAYHGLPDNSIAAGNRSGC